MSKPQSQAELPWYRYSNVFNIENTGHTVIVNCKGTRFSLHLGIIGEHSEYFQRCFKHPFKERASAEVTIDHLDPQTLGVYFNLVYRLASQPATTTTTTSKGDRAAAPHLVIPTSFWYDGTLSQIINLHDTCDYLLDARLMHYVRETIYNFLNYWRHRSQNSQRSGKLMTFRSFAEAYDLCDGAGALPGTDSQGVHFWCHSERVEVGGGYHHRPPKIRARGQQVIYLEAGTAGQIEGYELTDDFCSR
ncbi:hypothetical protein CkaCkLH20_11055 [Colletotrichum karsti]|uniref:BTB domain-containing protein n=1 Tax=Colletotrichum karsti TaxID=1095194 RepID=A0A9P6LFE7_9PEZI|nr:uncharacterized protein CkaCkLH20_11055 [Colletotrichum karsti]KAF9871408.1 hypothetical protein CkaCkLH20_11055 [Colletotrichum karsti]